MTEPDHPADISCMARSRDEAIARMPRDIPPGEIVINVVAVVLALAISYWMGWIFR